MKRFFLLFFIPLLYTFGLSAQEKNISKMKYKVQKTETEWRQSLTEDQYKILRQKGTEQPHTGEYNMHFEKGTYHCAGCGQQLFDSDTKFDAHCGWPSFDQAIEGTIEYKKDFSYGMERIEILCNACGGHLGHVFNDGPTNTGLRYCVNSISLKFKPQKEN